MWMTEPAGRRALWMTWAKWVLGLPLVLGGVMALVWGAIWLSGGSLMTRTELDIGTIVLYLGGLALMYPFLVVMWTAELRAGLRARAAWDSMTPDERAAAQPPRRRRTRKATA
jgi:hypothetical protein